MSNQKTFSEIIKKININEIPSHRKETNATEEDSNDSIDFEEIKPPIKCKINEFSLFDPKFKMYVSKSSGLRKPDKLLIAAGLESQLSLLNLNKVLRTSFKNNTTNVENFFNVKKNMDKGLSFEREKYLKSVRNNNKKNSNELNIGEIVENPSLNSKRIKKEKETINFEFKISSCGGRWSESPINDDADYVINNNNQFNEEFNNLKTTYKNNPEQKKKKSIWAIFSCFCK